MRVRVFFYFILSAKSIKSIAILPFLKSFCVPKLQAEKSHTVACGFNYSKYFPVETKREDPRFCYSYLAHFASMRFHELHP